MEKSSIEAIVRSLNEHGVQYIIVGGLAVVAHGYVRFTADIDLILALDKHNLSLAAESLKGLEYRPRAPVSIEEFIDPANRQKWISEKGAMVFSLFSPRHPATEVDLFLDPPIDFAKASSGAIRADVAPGVSATFCGKADLIEMKIKAGRSRDLEDIAKLRQLDKDAE